MPIETTPVGIPDRFEIEEGGGTLRIGWKWPRIAGVVIAVFAVSWNGFLVSWYSNLLTQGSAPSAMFTFPIVHVVVGLVLPYVALAFFLNYTLVEVGEGMLKVRHRPLPFPGNRTVSSADVRQLFCVERTGRKGSQRIESRLGLAHRAVAGELSR